MRIILLTAYFPPDTGSASHLFYELGKAFLKRGHEVVTITSIPGYFPKGNMQRYRRKFVVKEVYEGIHVVRLASPKLPRHIPLARAIWQFSLAAFFTLPLLFIKKSDVILVYSPPLTLGLTSWIISSIKKLPFIFNVQDLFPQSVIDLGLLKNKLFIKLCESIEKFIYKKSTYITVHSSGNKDNLIKKGVNPERVLVINNWVDTEFIRPHPKENSIRKKYNLNNKFIVSFAGIIGYSQDIDVLLESAKRLESYKDIKFLIVGDGVQKARMLQKAKEMDVKNVIFLPMLPKKFYPEVLYASDVCVTTLHSFVKTPVVPSKILSTMAAGKPVIACLNLYGDVPKIINDANCGFSINPEDPELLSEIILKLYKNPRLCEEYGRNGRCYAERHFSLDRAAEKYEKLFMKVIG